MIVTNFLESSLKFFLPEFFLISAILVLVLYGSIFSVSKEYQFPLIHLAVSRVSLMILIVTCFLVLLNVSCTKIVFHGAFICDTLSQCAKGFSLFSTTTYLVVNISYIKKYRRNAFEYQILILLCVLGLMLLCSSYDLLSIYLALELQSLCLYVLAAFNRESAYSTEAGLKYFILGVFSSGLLLFGMSILYGFTGTTNLEDLRILFHLGAMSNSTIQTGVALITCAFLFKISAAPFHIWTPDVYEGAPINTTFFFAVTPKTALVLGIIRFYPFSLGVQPEIWQHIFFFSALLSVVAGSFLALKQRKMKRLFAYSAVGHIGYILLGIASCEIDGLHAAIFYLLIYLISSFGIWSLITSINNFSIKVTTLADFSLIHKSNPQLALSGILLFFSLAGIPPLSGFYAKFCVFIASMNSAVYVYSLAILIISVISTYYYLRMVKSTYFETKIKRANFYPLPKEVSHVLSTSCSLLLFLFINPNLLWRISYELCLHLYF